MKAIGKHFSDEIAAAGLSGLPFSWGDDGKIEFGPAMTQQQRDAVMAVYEAHDPDNDPLQYVRLRAEAYPPLGDQLDAILKGFQALRGSGTTLPSDLDGIIGKWQDVKQRFPKSA